MSRNKSHALFSEAQRLMPGGVNSPARAFGAVGGEPIVFERGEGAYLFDVDGNRYIDYIGSWGPMILGHGHPAVVAALHEAAACRDDTPLRALGRLLEADIQMRRVPRRAHEALRLLHRGKVPRVKL